MGAALQDSVARMKFVGIGDSDCVWATVSQSSPRTGNFSPFEDQEQVHVIRRWIFAGWQTGRVSK